MEELEKKLTTKNAHVGVVGLGYVGLPLAVELCRAGYSVTGIDISDILVQKIAAGRSVLPDLPSERLEPLVRSNRLRATTSFQPVSEMDAVSICVPTPLRKTKDPDISHVKKAAQAVAANLRSPTLIVLESTTYPGTTDELIVPILTAGDRRLGKDVFVAFSPERVDPGNPIYKIRNTPKVIGGVTPACSKLAAALYSGVIDEIHIIDSAREAEMVKLLENTFRAVNIALVNEMLLMSDRMGIDMWRVVEAAATKPFGFLPFFPGPGIGGHCIPLDPMYLSWKAKSFGFFNRFIELATDINGNMPRFVVDKLMRVLNTKGKHLKDSRILVVGVAYKPNVSDTRESPGVELLRLLRAAEAEVSYHDPFVPTLSVDTATFESAALDRQYLGACDCVLVATAHPQLDLTLIADSAPLILDTRNAFRSFRRPNIVRL